MSLSLLRSRSVFTVLGAAALLAGAVGPSLSAQTAQTTTFTGTVYSPLGPPNGDPIPNILVFAVNPLYPPPVFSQGVVPGPTGQNNCSLQPSLVPTTVLGSAVTDAAGKFTFSTFGVLPNPVTIVIQAGKWRRQYQFDNTQVRQGMVNMLPALSMPSATSTTTYPLADLPHIAVVTGSADAIECIFSQLGIANSEITDPPPYGTGSINFFVGKSSGGGKISNANTPGETALVNTTAAMENYDLIMFGCQGNTGEASSIPNFATTNGIANNLTDYTSSGGRVFGTHFEYIWLEDNSTFKSVATWGGSYSESSTTVPIAASIDTSYPNGAILANWLSNIGALTSNPPPIIGFTNVRQNTTAVANPPAQSWANLLPYSSQNAAAQAQGQFTGTPSMQFTFDTPIGAAGTPTVAITYTNNTTTFLQGDVADTITLNVVNSSATATSPGLTLTISLPGGLTPTGLMGVGNTGWVCNPATLICVEPGALAAGATDSVQLTFSIAPTEQVGQVSLTGTLTGGGLSGSGSQQCGRVLYNDYHVEPPSGNNAGTLYNNPSYCSNTASGAKKFLEYSLYDISNFVAPSTSDLIQIHGISTLNWPQPAAIPYGTALSATQLDATASDVDSGTSLPGTFVYSPVAGTIPNAPSVNVSVTFTPTDSTDYSTASANRNIAVTPDATTTTLTVPVTPIFYGQVIALTAVEGVSSNGPATTLDGGMLNFLIDGVVTCSFTEPTPGGTSSCPPSTGAGYDARPQQPYMTQSVYTGDTDFAASVSPTYPVTVLPAPTSTSLALSANNVVVGTAVTFTSTVLNTVDSAAPVGTVTFLDNTIPIGTGAVSAQGTASVTISNLGVGPHSIMACYAAPANGNGTVNFVASCSAFVKLIVTLPPIVMATETLLTSNVNPSYFGQAITFTSSVSTTGAFVEIPQGTVTFFDGTTAIGEGTLDSKGNASITTSTLAIGTHNMTASYGGFGSFAASVSAVYVQVVNDPLTSAGNGFILQVEPTNITVPVGSNVSVNVTVIELNNFQQPVQLSCTGLPAEGVCTFAQSLIPATGGTTQLAIGATAPHDCGSNAPYFVAGGRGTALLWLGVTALGLFLARKRRRLLQSLALAAAMLLIPALQGCGTGNCTDFGLKPGTYTFTVMGVSSPGVTTVTSAATVTRTQAMTMNVTIQKQ